MDQLRNLQMVLLCFEAVSELRINLAKFDLVLAGNVPNMDTLAATLGCKAVSFPLKYLGLPLGAPFKSKVI